MEIHHPAEAVLHGAPPSGGDVSLVEAADGVQIRFALWPADGAPRGAILLGQGRTEYIEKAYDWIAQFRAMGLGVGAFDFRGQGLSERGLPNRRKGHIRDFGLYQHDYDAAFDALRGQVGGRPILVSGHSMGGLVTTRFLARRQAETAGAILSAPMLGLAFGRVLGGGVRALSTAATALGFGTRYIQGCDDRTGPDRGFDNNVLTSDRERFDAHSAMVDAVPDLKLGGTTHGWVAAGYREMRKVAALPRNWLTVPVLVLSASEDAVVSNAAQSRFAERNPLADLLILRGSRHEPMMETDAIQAPMWAGIDDFLNRIL